MKPHLLNCNARHSKAAARVTERGTRADDKASEAAMEDRKRAGYF